MPDIRQTGLLDDFQRADEIPLSWDGRWSPTDSGRWGPMVLKSGTATHKIQTGVANDDAWWTSGPSLSGDMEVWGYGVGGGAPGVSLALGLFKDVGGSSGAEVDGYRFRMEQTTGGVFYILYRFDNGTATQIAGGTGGSINLMLMRLKGNDVECWTDSTGTGLSASLILSTADPTYRTGLRLTMGCNSNSNDQLTAWEGFGGGKKNRSQIVRWPSN